ncbi:MAG TPA: hypothetical protein VK699_07110 [Terriglobales bacterium]|jgi:hypothetical protein|nr:hypothetical protein [Terriglobales bacterium]
MNQQIYISKKLRVAGILVILGLVVEGFSLLWNHPLSFLAFLCIGGVFLALGIVIYLLALVSRAQE